MSHLKKSKDLLISNIVEKDTMRGFQSKTLKVLANSLVNSFGPFGSNTIICKKGALTQYTKDGHTILKNILLQDCIENTVKTDIEDITRNVVKKVGDGTTAATILSSIIFDKLVELEKANKAIPYAIIKNFKDAVKDIKEEILKNSQEFDHKKAYNIAYVSTNGNEKIAKEIEQIYLEFGNDVFIDVTTSINEKTYIKVYDGMTLDKGYSDSVFINDTKKGSCTLNKPNIYAFEDPVDTREMMSLFASIIDHNIFSRLKEGQAPISTMIMMPAMSRDMEAYIEQLVNYMYEYKKQGMDLPILIITGVNKDNGEYQDIIRLCGAKPIKKYINVEQQKVDQENGIAPTLENVCEFFGSADIVESDLSKTKFVNPSNMYIDGEKTEDFDMLLRYLEAELDKAYENGENNNVTGNLKRRINSLKANMVQYYIGGISMSDRDSLRDLVEDAVLNCRSASKNGVGYGANFEGLYASYKLQHKSEYHKIIFDSFIELSKTLYKTSGIDDKQVEELIEKSFFHKCPYDLRNEGFNGLVMCTIQGDIAILNSIAQILTLMITSNQYICPDPSYNRYLIL